MLRERLEHVYKRIQQACQRSGRDPSSITLVGVTKTIPEDAIREAMRLGLRDLGENRVQEALAKREALGADAQGARWHFIGHLQRNKARHAAEIFDVIQSVDSVVLVGDLERHAAACGRRLDALVQVNVSGEAAKSGCRPDAVPALLDALRRAPHLAFAGFMTIPPLVERADDARVHFRLLRRLRDELGLSPAGCKLSMGMSNDFDVAIEEGADMIRVGTALFGARA